jgi:hypothetical protein
MAHIPPAAAVGGRLKFMAPPPSGPQLPNGTHLLMLALMQGVSGAYTGTHLLMLALMQGVSGAYTGTHLLMLALM